MKKFVIASVVALVAVSVAVTAAFAGSSKSAAEAPACVLLPDTKSSVRWQTQDRPTFIAAFKKAGVAATVVNAEGDAQKMVSQADQCLANGAKVVLADQPRPGLGLQDHLERPGTRREGHRLRPPQHRLQGCGLLRVVR